MKEFFFFFCTSFPDGPNELGEEEEDEKKRQEKENLKEE